MDIIKLYNSIILKNKNHHPLDLISCKYICDVINKNNFKSCLEIGTGLGFSSCYFAINSNIEKIITIEKNYENYCEAKSLNISNKIEYINDDAYTIDINNKFDFIFIDGPKSNQRELFEKFINNLNQNGTLIIDNIFLSRVNSNSKNGQKLIKKNEEFKSYLISKSNQYKIEFVNIGDGIAVIKKG